jgi:hypothetical protein
MSASYLGTFPVSKIVASNIIGQGIVVKTQKIVTYIDSAEASLPSINSVFSEDSTLWVTDSKMENQIDGLAEITVVAQGPSSNPSTTLEIQPGGPFIYGLTDGQIVNIGPTSFTASTGYQDYPSGANPSSGSTIKVSFVSYAGQENSLISTYSYKAMPTSINGIILPRYKASGIYGNSILAVLPGQEFPNPNWRLTYKGFICKDIQIQRQGAALAVSLYFKESGYLETYTPTSANSGTISKVWDY